MSGSIKKELAQEPYPRRGYIPQGNAPRVKPGYFGSAVQKPAADAQRPPQPASEKHSLRNI